MSVSLFGPGVPTPSIFFGQQRSKEIFDLKALPIDAFELWVFFTV
jgi:hypothetical protein